MLCCILSPDANTDHPFPHANGTTFRRTNCQLRLKRSGIPSRLSLRRQWIPSPLKAFLTVCFGRWDGLYLLLSIKTFMIFFVLICFYNNLLLYITSPINQDVALLLQTLCKSLPDVIRNNFLHRLV